MVNFEPFNRCIRLTRTLRMDRYSVATEMCVFVRACVCVCDRIQRQRERESESIKSSEIERLDVRKNSRTIMQQLVGKQKESKLGRRSNGTHYKQIDFRPVYCLGSETNKCPFHGIAYK